MDTTYQLIWSDPSIPRPRYIKTAASHYVSKWLFVDSSEKQARKAHSSAFCIEGHWQALKTMKKIFKNSFSKNKKPLRKKFDKNILKNVDKNKNLQKFLEEFWQKYLEEFWQKCLEEFWQKKYLE